MEANAATFTGRGTAVVRTPHCSLTDLEAVLPLTRRNVEANAATFAGRGTAGHTHSRGSSIRWARALAATAAATAAMKKKPMKKKPMKALKKPMKKPCKIQPNALFGMERKP